MPDPAAPIRIRVASLLQRPRNLPPAPAEEAYRASESLALGLDIALAAHGVKRTSFIAQRPNRLAFEETWAPPGGWAAFEDLLRALTAGPPPAADRDPAAARVLIGAPGAPARFVQLLDHGASPWYYVPRAFDPPLWVPAPRPQTAVGPEPERLLSLGSVPALVTELDALEPLLRAQGRDPDVWFPAPLLEATAISLETGLVIALSLD